VINLRQQALQHRSFGSIFLPDEYFSPQLILLLIKVKKVIAKSLSRPISMPLNKSYFLPNQKYLSLQFTSRIVATAPGSISTHPETAQVTLAPLSAQEPAEPQNYVFPRHKLKVCPADKDPVVLLACGSFSPITYLHLRMFGA
jgi:hypothetical protein